MSDIDYVLSDIATEIEEHVKHWDMFNKDQHIAMMRSFQEVVLEHIGDYSIKEQAEINIANLYDDDEAALSH